VADLQRRVEKTERRCAKCRGAAYRADVIGFRVLQGGDGTV
jgi:primosomal protein N''